jgi:hypothetical protein
MMAEPSPRPDYKSDDFGQQAYATKPRWGTGASRCFRVWNRLFGDGERGLLGKPIQPAC